MRYLFLAAFLCFPIALVFGWIFDIRRDGLYRTRKAGPDEIVETKLQRPDYAILAALLAVGLAVLLGSAEMIQKEIEQGPRPALFKAVSDQRAGSCYPGQSIPHTGGVQRRGQRHFAVHHSNQR